MSLGQGGGRAVCARFHFVRPTKSSGRAKSGTPGYPLAGSLKLRGRAWRLELCSWRRCIRPPRPHLPRTTLPCTSLLRGRSRLRTPRRCTRLAQRVVSTASRIIACHGACVSSGVVGSRQLSELRAAHANPLAVDVVPCQSGGGEVVVVAHALQWSVAALPRIVRARLPPPVLAC